jgi:hypothetical protein
VVVYLSSLNTQEDCRKRWHLTVPLKHGPDLDHGRQKKRISGVRNSLCKHVEVHRDGRGSVFMGTAGGLVCFVFWGCVGEKDR